MGLFNFTSFCSKSDIGRIEGNVLVRKPEVKRPLGRPRRGWKDNIKMDLQKVDVELWTGSRIGTDGGHL